MKDQEQRDVCAAGSALPRTEGRVYIVLVNWNGWADTVECLESLFRLDYPDFRVIVCDNASPEGSFSYIRDWAEGRLGVFVSEYNPLRDLTFPPLEKPIVYADYDRATTEKGGRAEDDSARLILTQTGANLGFAGASNVGLRYALARDDFDYVWLLNNDTVVRPDALRLMVDRMAQAPNAGICGSTLLYYERPDTIQALAGATYNKWLATSRHICGLLPLTEAPCPDRVAARMSYVVGASMLVRKAFLRNVGLMCEDYFLYCEEMDWIGRAKGRYAMAYSEDSVVYHKEGAATGGLYMCPTEKSFISDYSSLRSRLLLTRKLFPYCLPTVLLSFLIRMAIFIRRGQYARAGMVMDLMIRPWKVGRYVP